MTMTPSFRSSFHVDMGAIKTLCLSASGRKFGDDSLTAIPFVLFVPAAGVPPGSVN
jgi:hypothetical protein